MPLGDSIIGKGSGSESPSRGRPRGPGIVYGALSLCLIVIVGLVAISQRNPPPPSIAEFAPQAVDQITDAPDEQTSRFGRGGSGPCPPDAIDCDEEGGAVGPTAEQINRSTIDVPRVRKCIGDPPRQIEDPQAPPCVPYWEGDNGGDTYKGVTRNEIRVGTSEAQDWYPLLLRFFNRRFEFYGRKLEMVKIGCGGLSATQEQQHACAQDADEEKKVFAVTHGGAQRPPFIAAVAKRGLVHVSSQPYMTEQTMSELHPGSWQYPMALNKIMSNMGSWVCSRLHGFDAVHAGDPLLQRSKRVFGIVYHELDDPNADTEPIEREMERCGATPKKVVKDPYSFTTKYQTKASTIMVDMKNEGVTSIICLCQATAFGDLTRAATLQRYRPEWLISSYAFLDIDWQIRQWSDPNQLAQAFGLTFNPRHWRLTDQPAVWAVKEVDPEYSTANRSEDSYWMHGLMRDYRSLLLLASGIQMAGPHLTNETFARALQRTTFPNPDHYLMAGKVGFEQRSHSMTTDAAEWWWGAAARSPYGTEGAQSGQGALCYVDGGARHSQGNWPRGGDPFFDNPAACDSGG